MKIQSKLKLKQGEKRLGEDISINTIKVGDLVKVKKYGWIMRVDDIKGDFYYLENSKKGFDLSGKSGNAGSYLINEIQKINNISGTKQATKRTKGSNYHKDTKSHNVNIRVISGVENIINTDKTKNYIQTIQSTIERIEQKLNDYKKRPIYIKDKSDIKEWNKEKRILKYQLAFSKKNLKDLRKQLSNQLVMLKKLQ